MKFELTLAREETSERGRPLWNVRLIEPSGHTKKLLQVDQVAICVPCHTEPSNNGRGGKVVGFCDSWEKNMLPDGEGEIIHLKSEEGCH